MNENIDLTKILEGCPKGTKFYSSVYGEVSFERIDISDDEYPIIVRFYNKCMTSIPAFITKDGQSSSVFNGECILFPSKDQRDWSKFERFWDKPKVEKFDPNTFQPFDKVLVSDGLGSVWRTDFYSFNDPKYCNDSFPIVTSGGCYRYAIPYNKDTKHLLGTTDDCPEYYKWWED